MSSHPPIKSLLGFPPCPPCICADSKHLPITVAIFRNYISFQHWNPKHPLFPGYIFYSCFRTECTPQAVTNRDILFTAWFLLVCCIQCSSEMNFSYALMVLGKVSPQADALQTSLWAPIAEPVGKCCESHITELQGTSVPLWPAYIGFLTILAMEGANRGKGLQYWLGLDAWCEHSPLWCLIPPYSAIQGMVHHCIAVLQGRGLTSLGISRDPSKALNSKS